MATAVHLRGLTDLFESHEDRQSTSVQRMRVGGPCSCRLPQRAVCLPAHSVEYRGVYGGHLLSPGNTGRSRGGGSGVASQNDRPAGAGAGSENGNNDNTERRSCLQQAVVFFSGSTKNATLSTE